MSNIPTKEDILGLSFYPHECGSMIECVTKQDALKAMQKYADSHSKNIAIGFENWKFENGWLYNAGYYYQPEESTPFLSSEQLFDQYLQYLNK